MINSRSAQTVENASTGWLVQAGQRYYTGDVHNPLVTWSPFPKFAKVYKHQKRAQKAALRLGGQVVPVESSALLLNGLIPLPVPSVRPK